MFVLCAFPCLCAVCYQFPLMWSYVPWTQQRATLPRAPSVYKKWICYKKSRLDRIILGRITFEPVCKPDRFDLKKRINIYRYACCFPSGLTLHRWGRLNAGRIRSRPLSLSHMRFFKPVLTKSKITIMQIVKIKIIFRLPYSNTSR